jgi:hypothetical protein
MIALIAIAAKPIRIMHHHAPSSASASSCIISIISIIIMHMPLTMLRCLSIIAYHCLP